MQGVSKADGRDHTWGRLIEPLWGHLPGEESLFAERCLPLGRAGQIVLLPQVRPMKSPPGTALLGRGEVRGTQALKGDKTSNPKPGLLDTHPRGTRTRADLPLHGVPQATCRKLTSSPSQPHRPAQGPSDERITGPELRHAHCTQAGLPVKARARGAFGRKLYFTSPLSYLAKGGRPSAQHSPAQGSTFPDAPTLCTAFLGEGPAGSHEPPAPLRGCAPSP